MKRDIRQKDEMMNGYGCTGTDGARTRSFRLDRAVLWPIELQSQENEIKWTPTYTYSYDFIQISLI